MKDVGFPGDFTLVNQDLASNLLAPSTDLAVPKPPATASFDDIQISLASIQHEAHLNRLELQKGMAKGKGTDEAYPRHVKNYVRFWEADQERRLKENSTYVKIPAHPIIGEKVAIFLQSEITRNKVRLISESHSAI